MMGSTTEKEEKRLLITSSFLTTKKGMCFMYTPVQNKKNFLRIVFAVFLGPGLVYQKNAKYNNHTKSCIHHAKIEFFLFCLAKFNLFGSNNINLPNGKK